MRTIELVCGCAMLRDEASADVGAVIDMTFSLIDCGERVLCSSFSGLYGCVAN